MRERILAEENNELMSFFLLMRVAFTSATQRSTRNPERPLSRTKRRSISPPGTRIFLSKQSQPSCSNQLSTHCSAKLPTDVFNAKSPQFFRSPKSRMLKKLTTIRNRCFMSDQFFRLLNFFHHPY
jgi:hypothetical protein